TGSPIPGVEVRVNGIPAPGLSAKADSNGRYAIQNIPPGSQRITAQYFPSRGYPIYATRTVQVSPGQEVSGVTLSLTRNASISGKVVDQNKKAVAGASVILVAREYSLGALRHVYAAMAMTGDQGEYALDSVRPGRAYLLMVQKRNV